MLYVYKLCKHKNAIGLGSFGFIFDLSSLNIMYNHHCFTAHPNGGRFLIFCFSKNSSETHGFHSYARHVSVGKKETLAMHTWRKWTVSPYARRTTPGRTTRIYLYFLFFGLFLSSSVSCSLDYPSDEISARTDPHVFPQKRRTADDVSVNNFPLRVMQSRCTVEIDLCIRIVVAT
jgi:hypothetical protein